MGVIWANSAVYKLGGAWVNVVGHRVVVFGKQRDGRRSSKIMKSHELAEAAAQR
jgi:hypothetical protein